MLIKTQAFLVNRSYDPKFNASYISRFITGVIAGVILAYGLSGFVNANTDKTGVLTGTLTPGVLGILGGFSAEAVEVILHGWSTSYWPPSAAMEATAPKPR